MDEIHVHKTKKSICAHFAESPCIFPVLAFLMPYKYIGKDKKDLVDRQVS